MRQRVQHLVGSLLGLLVATLAPEAAAITPPAHHVGRPVFEVVAGPPVRQGRDLVWYRAPHRARGWSALEAELGRRAWAAWDRATGVPARVWGTGAPAPGSHASAARAGGHARAFLDRHLDLLAPGSRPGDLVMVSTELDAGVRSVGFAQHAAGMPVVGGQVSLRFKADRLVMIGSEALPHVRVDVPAKLVSPAAAQTHAEAWVAADHGAVATVGAVEGPMVLPLVTDASVSYRVVLRVRIDGDEPVGSYDVYVDAETGARVARQQTVAFATGTLHYDVSIRWPGGGRAAYPASFSALEIGGEVVSTDAFGLFLWDGDATASAVARATGQWATVSSETSPDATLAFDAADGEVAVWSAADDELVDAQLTTFVHTNLVVERVRTFASGLPALDQAVPSIVNIDASCNAFYRNGQLHFYRSSATCGNTGQMGDVVYHELGHLLHHAAIIPGVGLFDSALSEGLSDYLAVTITGDPGMARGFWKTDQPLRHLDPDGSERSWPRDIGQAHSMGQIIGGTLWDLRKLLVAEHGHEAGVLLSDTLAYQAQRRAVDIPTMYFETLLADDDDGDLGNGTPNACAIHDAYGRHGLRRIGAEIDAPTVAPPHQPGYPVRIRLSGLVPSCAADDIVEARLSWQRRDDPDVGGSVVMDGLGLDRYEAAIPPQPDGATVGYRIELTMADGGVHGYPQNAADPFFDLFVGHVEPLYCTGFETDPAADGWTHALTSGTLASGADDWMWGPPEAPPTSYDPPFARSGEHVYGNDLGPPGFNGVYQANKVNQTTSPVVDASAYDAVHLQAWRWLTVEDGTIDRARVYAGDTLVWANEASAAGQGATGHHLDEDWRFVSLPLTGGVDEAGQVAVTFELATGAGLVFGGWTLDDLCVVGWVPTVCGDGRVTGAEECDDGDANDDVSEAACRTTCLLPRCGDGIVDVGEICDDGNAFADDGCEPSCEPGPIMLDPPGDPPPEDPPPEPGDPPPGDLEPLVVDTSALDVTRGLLPSGGCACTTTSHRGSPGGGGWLLALGLWSTLRRRSTTRR